MSERRVPERRTKGHPASTGFRWQAFGRVAPLLLPLLLVNAVAIAGQSGWAYDRIDTIVADPQWQLPLSVAFACAIELIGIYLAWEAHLALMADQASGLLRAGSYAVGGFAGWMNWDHWNSGSPSFALALALMSAISPWLWAVYSRARNRTRLAELEMADTRGVKLSTARKVWHPWRSLKVVRWAAWAGTTAPRDAVAGWEEARGKRETPPLLTGEQIVMLALLASLAKREPKATPRPAVATATSRPAISAPAAPRKSASPEPGGGGSESARGRQAQRERAERAAELVRAEYGAGRSISASQLAAQFPPMSTSWATNILRSVRPESPNGSKIAAG